MSISLEFQSGFSSFRPQVRSSLVKAGELLFSHAGHSFSRILGNSFRQTISRILSDSRMSTEVMLSSHIQASVKGVKAPELLLLRIPATYSFGKHRQMEGLTELQKGVKALLQHNTFCMTDSGQALGLLDQYHWVRKGKNAFSVESQKWFRGLEAVNRHLGHLEKEVVLVQDREADIFDFFKAKRAPNVELLVRVFQGRKFRRQVNPETEKVAKMRQMAPDLPLLGQHRVSIQRGNKRQTLTLEIQAAPVDVLPRKALSARLHKTQGLSLVVATEIASIDANGKDCFQADKAAQWLLLTSLEAQALEQAITVVKLYAKRWGVERFHYTMKSGALKVNTLQFDDIETTFNAFALYSIVAWRIMYLNFAVKTQPEQTPQRYFSEQELKILQTKDTQANQSMHHAIRALGKLVNWVPTTKQPYPKIKITAEALWKLKELTLFLTILKQNPKPLQD